MSNNIRRCENCDLGQHFKPRADELQRYGADVMGCKKTGFEGYTTKSGVCEFFWQAGATQ